MNAKGLVLSAITVQGQAVTFGVKGVPGDPTFKGTLVQGLENARW